MRMYDLIMKKRNGGVLTDQEIEYMVNGYVKGEIADYQMSAMLMSIWFKGMNDHEIGELTQVMARSGDMIDLSGIEGKKVDKHSTECIGFYDTQTCVDVCPIACIEPHPEHVETQQQLLEKFKGLNLFSV